VGLGSNKLRLYEIVGSKALSKSTSKADVKRLLKVEGNRSLDGSYDDKELDNDILKTENDYIEIYHL